MRLLPTLLLLLVLPGLLLPAGSVLSLCRCARSRSQGQVAQRDVDAAEQSGALSGSCCAATQYCCCGTRSKRTPRDDAGGTTARAHKECKCPVLQVPDRKAAATAPDSGGDPSPQPLAVMQASPAREPAQRCFVPGSYLAAPRPPPDRARNLPLLL